MKELETEVENVRGNVHVPITEPSSFGKFPICYSPFYPTTFCGNNLYQKYPHTIYHIFQ